LANTRTKFAIILDYLAMVANSDDLAHKVLKWVHQTTLTLWWTLINPWPKKYHITLKIAFSDYGDDSKLDGYNDGYEHV